METLNLDLDKRYSFADYLTWADDKRRELLDGFVKLMTPAPKRVHQELSVQILEPFLFYLKKKPCKVFHAPFDVRLPKNKDTSDDKILTVVQPDICIICDPEKLDDRGCIGSPDLIVEIISRSTAKHDIHTKYELYEQHGVLEYWIVSPNDQTISVFLLQAGKYQLRGIYTVGDFLPVHVFNDDLVVDLTEVFETLAP